MLGLIFAAAIAAAPQAQAVPAADCPKAKPTPVQEQGRSTAPRKLDELPPANLYRTVLRSVGGCPIVEVNVGGDWVLRPDAGAARIQPVPTRRGR